jgi:uncharacterized protein Yka (UPF0111/DUF47 family)
MTIEELHDKVQEISREIDIVSKGMEYVPNGSRENLRSLLDQVKKCESDVQSLQNNCIIKLSLHRPSPNQKQDRIA